MNRACIGKNYPAVTYEVGREKIREYALAIKENNPLFLDPEFAKRSGYGKIVAPPTFVAVYCFPLFDMIFVDSELNLYVPRIVHAEQEFTFGEIVRSGDVIISEATIVSMFSKKGRSGATNNFVVIHTTSRNQDGKMVCEGMWTLVERGDEKDG